jgi:hypothetical protein
MSNWFADQIGSLAGDVVYAFGGGAAEQAQGNQLDAQLAQLNGTEYGAGGRIYNEIQDQQGTAAADKAAQTVQADEASGATGNVLDQLQTAGQEGANQGLNDFWGSISSALKGLLTIFPWWLWLGAGVGLFIYLGGLGFLARMARRKLSA